MPKWRQLAVVLLVAGATLLPSHQVVAAPTEQGYTYEECGTVDAAALRSEIETLAADVFSAGTADIDVAAVVDRAWFEQGMDAVVDGAVAAAVQRARQNSGYWSRFLSGWSVEHASAFATVIAEDAFASPTFTAALEELSATVATGLTEELAAVTARAGSTALLCLQEYVGDQYSTSVYELFEQEIAAEFADLTLAAPGAIDVSTLELHTKGLTGVSVIIVAQLVRRVSLRLSREVGERVAGRVVGRVLGRLGSSLIPVAGWVIGGGLLVWDLVEGSRGALPQIQQTLTSPEIKASIADELAVGVEEALTAELELVARRIADDMVDEWQLFCSRHPLLCTLPAESDSFRVILDTTPVQQLEPLAALVDVYMNSLGRIALEEAMETGHFERLLVDPAFAAEIIRTTGSADEAAAWLERDPEARAAILAANVPQHFKAAELSDSELVALTALQDPAAVAAVAALTPTLRTAVLDGRPQDVAAVITTQEPGDVAWLAAYADASGTPLARLLAQVASGGMTVVELQAAATATAAVPTAVASPVTATPAMGEAPAATPFPVSAPWGTPFSPILMVAVLLLVTLGVAGLLIRLWYGINRT